MQNQDFDLHIFSDLGNTGETPRQKASPPRFFAPELSLRLVRWSFSPESVAEAKLRRDINRKCMAFCTRLAHTAEPIETIHEVSIEILKDAQFTSLEMT